MGYDDNSSSNVDLMVEESPNNRFVRYDEVLGTGSFKIVYKGFDREDGTEIAWNKITLNDNEDSLHLHRDRLLNEASLLRKLKNEHITKCYCYWVDDESRTFNMITELCCSGSLKKYRYKHKCVDIKAIRNWGRQILGGLCYLHSQSPPVVHRDLKCDNIFVNGNNAEVKIGDLGFATVLHLGKATSVIGTPEFMAPEVFEDEYDESVDIYAFGMCMLELVTCERPYSECRNAGQIYKKVISGVKPLALGRVKDPQARSFIDKCFVPASERSSAAELLKDPFLSCGNSKDFICRQPLKCASVNVSRPSPPIPLEVCSSYGRVLEEGKQVRYVSEASAAKTLEFYISSEKKEWRLRGDKVEDNSVSLILSIINTALRKRHKFEFIFRLDCDDANSVAHELLLCDDEFSNEDLAPTVELMNILLLHVGGGWRPQKYVVKGSHDHSVESHHFEEFTWDGQTVTKINKALVSEIITPSAYASKSCGCSLVGSVVSNTHTMDSVISFFHSYSGASTSSSSNTSLGAHADKDQWKGEFELIDSQ